MNQNLMLGTIRIPKNLRLLSERLPKSNYGKKSKADQKSSFNQDDSVSKSNTQSFEATKENTSQVHNDSLHPIREEIEHHEIKDSPSPIK
jgi:hypothetical protein